MKTFSPKRRHVASYLILLSLGAPLRAGTMLSPALVLGTDLGTFSPDTPLANMINQSGLDKSFTSGVTDFDEYFDSGDPPFGQGSFINGWQSDFTFNLPLTGFIDFDLGDVYAVDRLAIWNRSLQTGRILFSETLGGAMVGAGDFSLQNRLNFPFSYLPEFIEFDSTHQARYMRIEVTSAHKFDVTDTFAYAIVGEVVLDVAPIPGDFDLDRDVDADDLTDWQSAFGLTDGADADNDGDSDGADFLIWQQQLGVGAAGAASLTAVPEPRSTIAIFAAIAATSMLAKRTNAPRHIGPFSSNWPRATLAQQSTSIVNPPGA